MCMICAMKGGSSAPHSIGGGHTHGTPQALAKGAFIPSTGTTSSSAVKTLVEGYSWTGTVGQATSVSYSFSMANGTSDVYGLTARATLNGTQQTQAESALQAWANVANVTFTETTGFADINMRLADMPSGVAGWMAPSVSSATQLAHADIVMDHAYSNMVAGSYAFMAMMHEIGHALGLKHPGNYNGSGAGSGAFLSKALDSHDVSIMSYYSGKYTNTWYKNPETPMIYDIAAIQFLYGANHAYNSGDTTYSYTGGYRVLTIWDGAGTDTISAETTSSNNTIDLREGITNVTTIGNTNVWVAFGANIEGAAGGTGNDTLHGNKLNNTLSGNGGNDTLYGYEGNDTLVGGSGANTLDGGIGDDRFIVSGNDTVLGGVGNDTIDGASGAGTTKLDGGAGNDSITGGAGTDLVLGGVGNDSLLGGVGNDTLRGESGNDTIHAGDDDDTADGGVGNDQLFGGNGNDSLLGFAGNDTLDGEAGNDTLNGGVGNDVLLGGLGDDVFLSEAGNDTLTGGAGNDTFIFLARSGVDRILDFEGAGDTVADVIHISSRIYTNVGTLLNFVNYSGSDAVINLGAKNGSITLVGVSGGLNASDFVIV